MYFPAPIGVDGRGILRGNYCAIEIRDKGDVLALGVNIENQRPVEFLPVPAIIGNLAEISERGYRVALEVYRVAVETKLTGPAESQ